MKKLLIYIGAFLTLVIMVACSTDKISDETQLNELSDISSNILELASSLPKTRITGTKEDIDTTKTIKEYLEKYDFTVELQEFEYVLTKNGFAFLKNEKLGDGFEVQTTGKSNNIIAYKNKDENKNNVIVCAHYDTTEKNQLNDNGLGVATILNYAKNMDSNGKYNIIYVFFTGEAQLIGSKYYGSSLTEEEKGKVIAVINLDEICGNDSIKVGFNDGIKNNAYYTFEDVIKDFVIDTNFNTIESIALSKYGLPVMNIGQLPENNFEIIESKVNRENIEQAYKILDDCLKL